MRYGNLCSRKGTTFIDLVISMGIIAVLFGAIFSVYFSILVSVNNIEVRTAAAELLSQQVEIVRNLPYGSVGTVGGVPAGIIPQQQTISIGNFSFVIQTNVRNIDDPFDGTLGGNPNDTAPSDYKLLTLTASCPWCVNFVPLSITTTAAPKNLESAGLSGDIFINVIDSGWATGLPAGIPYVSVRITNSQVAPSVDFTDTTNASGVLQLVGVPTSTLSYHVAVTKNDYTSDQTYPMGGEGNPNPKLKDATVSEQTVTGLTFVIDKTSQVNVSTKNNTCGAVGNVNFSVQGSKTIGTDPTVYKFSTSSATNANGTFTFSNMEWDTYAFSLNQPSYNLVGTMPLTPVTINPSSTVDFRFVVQAAANPAFLVTVVDAASGAGVQNASVNISKTGFSETQITGRADMVQTNWSGGQYSSQDGGIDATSNPGSLELLKNASGTYDTGITHWLISTTIDLGSSSSTLYSLSWNPVSQPPSTGPASIEFQLAANNDNATWNFVGPDGTPNTYYTSTSTLNGIFDGNRYLRYMVYMSTQDTNISPRLDDVSVEFGTTCVPPAQTLFTNLPQGTYAIDVTAANYNEETSTASVGAGFNQITLPITHL